MKKKPVTRRCFGRYCVEITSFDKILFPRSRITKGNLIDYYATVGPIMVPYMKDRLLTMQRFPEGIHEEGFYHKDVPDYFPSWIKRVPIKKQAGGSVKYLVCNNVATLVYLANQACITPHLFLSKLDALFYPDQLIFDIDPSRDNDFDTVKMVAWILKERLEGAHLVPFVKTTGSRGLHVVVPLKPRVEYDEVRTFAYTLAMSIAQEIPRKVTLEVRKSKRRGKVFIDTLRNSFSATAVAPYAVRAREGAPVAIPLEWDELYDKRLRSDSYTIKTVFKRLDSVGDVWKGIQRSARSLDSGILK